MMKFENDLYPHEPGRFTNAHDAARCYFDFETDKNPEPTSTAVGSPQRVAVYHARYMAGEELWHEDDEKLANETTRRTGQEVRKFSRIEDTTPLRSLMEAMR